ncbi:hypothetical protein ACFOLD_15985 [Kocuria carniphila]
MPTTSVADAAHPAERRRHPAWWSRRGGGGSQGRQVGWDGPDNG